MAEDSPPFSALRALEAAARHRSYTWAAKELKITHSAVSQSIRKLEDRLGAKLFERIGAGMEPSPAALLLARAYSEATKSLNSSLYSVSANVLATTLVVAMRADFGRLWFAPRLESLARSLPDLTVEIRSLDAAGAVPAEADVLVRCGGPPPEGWEAEILADLLVFPVCSPDFAAAHELTSPRDVAQAPLLSARDLPWELWFAGAGVAPSRKIKGHVFDDGAMMLDAAVRGHGIALTHSLLAEEFIRKGALVAPIGPQVDTGRKMIVAWPAGSAKARAAARFADWIKAEIRLAARG
jgi:DNA-binding transcriptional LysR family regulator